MWTLVYAQAAQTEGGGAGGLLGLMLPFIVIFGLMYVLMILPQQRRDKERRRMLDSLSKGDTVVTTGGICGSVLGLTDDHVVLRVDDDTTIKFVRSAIAHISSSESKSEKSEKS